MKQDLEQSVANHALLHTPIGVVITDNSEAIAWANLAFCEYFGISDVEMRGKSFQQLALDASATTNGLYLVHETDRIPKRWLLNVDSPAIDHNNGARVIRYFVDVSENMRLREENQALLSRLDALATRDELTGLMNKKALLQALAPQISRSRRYDNPLSIVVMDVASVFTERGESIPVVDSVIYAVSAYFRDQLRWVDLIGRTGATEFTLVLPETSEVSAQKLVQKIDQHLQALSLPNAENKFLKIVAKYGVSQWHKGDDMLLILQYAKNNLFEISATR